MQSSDDCFNNMRDIVMVTNTQKLLRRLPLIFPLKIKDLFFIKSLIGTNKHSFVNTKTNPFHQT